MVYFYNTPWRDEQIIDCLIMAGGKATRFDFSQPSFPYHEKPLIIFHDQYLIDYTLNAVENSNDISRIFVVTSPHTPKTFEILSARDQARYSIVSSPGDSYHDDLKNIIKTLHLGITLILTTDIPTITPDDIKLFIKQLKNNKTPSLAMMCNLSTFLAFHKVEISPNHIFKNSEDLSLVPVGINIIDGAYIEANNIPQKEMIISDSRLLHNINSLADYQRLLQYYPNGIPDLKKGT